MITKKQKFMINKSFRNRLKLWAINLILLIELMVG
jgi:hypothetical protein